MSLAPDRRRPAMRGAVTELRFGLGLRVLPLRVARFHWRARRAAVRAEDHFSLASATRPSDLAILLSLAQGRELVAELGTATGWTALAFALASPERRVWTYDPAARPEVERYRHLVDDDVRGRVEFVTAPGSAGPPGGSTFDLLYIDSSHEEDETIAEVRAWKPSLRDGGLIVFDDYEHPHFPGVRAAVGALGLDGRLLGTLFVHEVRDAD